MNELKDMYKSCFSWPFFCWTYVALSNPSIFGWTHNCRPTTFTNMVGFYFKFGLVQHILYFANMNGWV